MAAFLAPATIGGRTYLAPQYSAALVSAEFSGSYAIGEYVSAEFSGSYVIGAFVSAEFSGTYEILAPTGDGDLIHVGPSNTVNFDGGTNRVAFDGGTNRVDF